MPVGRTPAGPHPQLVALLRQQARGWLLQLPALLSPVEYKALLRYAGGTTRERMLRELAEAMEALTAVRPCVLVVEELHWSDTATIEWPPIWPSAALGRKSHLHLPSVQFTNDLQEAVMLLEALA